MGSSGDCYDARPCGRDALGESFFSTLERKLLQRHTFATRDEAGRAIFEFIEGWPHGIDVPWAGTTRTGPFGYRL